MKKKHDWERRLQLQLIASARTHFEPGKHDCCRAVADIVQAMTGEDIMKGYRSRYRSAAGAYKLLKKEGGLAALLAKLANAHGLSQVPVMQMRRGDLVISRADYPFGDNRIQSVGICLGSEVLFPAAKGWHSHHRSACLYAYRINENGT